MTGSPATRRARLAPCPCVAAPGRCRRRRSRGGWFAYEVATSVVLLCTLLGGLVAAQAVAGRLNHYNLCRQRCQAAASAAIDKVASSAQPLADGDVERLWPGVHVKIEQSPGQGDWAGMTLVRAFASSASRGGPVHVTLARYVLAKEAAK